ncbi:Virus attachment protein p12 family protein [Polystyrenella longa]|uniref:Virus attachment protein p12 family protein n=1 Tax=Polystyrenella longa TaxID=2528007 RepID=A0A518CKU6_9PLAN|nr:FeoB-associated Cys-rich membrane protein [Polystyrenella longa]QDU79849.1 Virus attachment protein p12 family protein [Polystyrenella longa]
MNQFWQMIIAILIVIGGAGYLGLKAKKLFRQIRSGGGGSACGTSCSGCSSAKPNESVVSLDFPEPKSNRT